MSRDPDLIYPSLTRYILAAPFGYVGGLLAVIGGTLLKLSDRIYGDEWDFKFHNTPKFKPPKEFTS